MPINKAEYLEEAKAKFSAIIAKHQLGDEAVRVTIVPLSAKQAIGSPCREDFSLLEGKEVMIEAQFRGSFGQAFTDQPQGFEGTLGNVQGLSPDTNHNRAIFISTLNAVMAHLGIATGVRHCRDDEPDRCGSQIAHNLLERFGGSAWSVPDENSQKEVIDMCYGYGFGFRGASPPWPYVGRGRGGLPRCRYPGAFMAPPFHGGYPAPGGMPYAPHKTRDQELDFLKEEANAVKTQLGEIEARVKELEAKEE